MFVFKLLCVTGEGRKTEKHISFGTSSLIALLFVRRSAVSMDFEGEALSRMKNVHHQKSSVPFSGLVMIKSHPHGLHLYDNTANKGVGVPLL